MPTKTAFWTTATTRDIAIRFIERWERDNNTPICPSVINEILAEHFGGRKVFRLAAECPHLTEKIDEFMRKDHKALAPLLGAAGKLIQRSIDAPPFVRTRRGLNGHDKNGRNGSGASVAQRFDKHEAGRTHWSDEERTILHEKVMELFRANPEEGITVAVITKAMHLALPEPRWRHLMGFKACGDNHPRAVAAVQEIVAKGLAPAVAPIEVEKKVFVPIDVPTMLRDVPLPTLAAVLAEREMEMRLSSYAALGVTKPAPLNPAQKLIVNGTDADHVEVLLPRVQVVGFRGTQHQEMLKRFAHHPVVILPSIDPSLPLDAKRIGSNLTKIFIDITAAPEAWRKLVVDMFQPDVRENVSGPARVLDHIKEVAGLWASKNPDEFRLWQQSRHN